MPLSKTLYFGRFAGRGYSSVVQGDKSGFIFAYDCLEKYLSEKYKLMIDDYESYPSEYHEGILYQGSILTKETIDSFIERVSSINIEDYINKIKEAKRNVLP